MVNKLLTTPSVEGDLIIPMWEITANKIVSENRAQHLNPSRVVFLYPIGKSEYDPNATLYTSKPAKGGGLLKVAQTLRDFGCPTIAFPTAGMGKWNDTVIDEESRFATQAVTNVYQALGAGYDILLPVRDKTIFPWGLVGPRGIKYEPAFWDPVRPPNRNLVAFYDEEIYQLNRFIQLDDQARLMHALTNREKPQYAAFLEGIKKDIINDAFVTKPTIPLRQTNATMKKAHDQFMVLYKEFQENTLYLLEQVKKPKSNSYIPALLESLKLNNTLRYFESYLISRQYPSAAEAAYFRTECLKALNDAAPILQQHRGHSRWNDISLWLKRTIGFFAGLFVVPGLIVQFSSRSGYVDVFFKEHPRTGSAKRLEHIQQGVEKIAQEIENAPPSDTVAPELLV